MSYFMFQNTVLLEAGILQIEQKQGPFLFRAR